MKTLLLSFVLFLFCPKALSQDLSLENISTKEGQTVTVCQKVQSITSTGSKTILISIGKPNTNLFFTVVIFGKDIANFSYNPVEFLKEKEICITGEVIYYRDNYLINISSEKQIKIKY